jgi:hypothetical protein
MTDSVVIDATDRFPGDPGWRHRPLPTELPANAIECMDRFQPPWTEEDIRAIHCPEIKLLPFVAMKDGEGDNPCRNAECYWCDEPSGNGHVDYKRGCVYAQLTIKAIERVARDTALTPRVTTFGTYSRRWSTTHSNGAAEAARSVGPRSRRQ